MVCGNRQRGSFDAKETYSAVAYLTSMRTFFAYVAAEDLDYKTVDFNTAFLEALVPEGTKVYVE